MLREEHTSLAYQSLRHLAEIERSNLSLQEAERETARTESLWEDAAAEEMCPTGVGSGDTDLLISATSSGTS